MRGPLEVWKNVHKYWDLDLAMARGWEGNSFPNEIVEMLEMYKAISTEILIYVWWWRSSPLSSWKLSETLKKFEMSNYGSCIHMLLTKGDNLIFNPCIPFSSPLWFKFQTHSSPLTEVAQCTHCWPTNKVQYRIIDFSSNFVGFTFPPIKFLKRKIEKIIKIHWKTLF